MSKYTREQIATDYNLWIEYVDPDGSMTKEEFDATSVDSKIELQDEMFGPEVGTENE